MIDFSKADVHIHLFEGGYQGGSLTSRPGVEVDELLCYQSLIKDHHIEAALVVGFEGDAFCRQNNNFLAVSIFYKKKTNAFENYFLLLNFDQED